MCSSAIFGSNTIFLIIILVQLQVQLQISSFPIERFDDQSNTTLFRFSVGDRKIIKSQLCPHNETSSFYRYHNETRRCYKVGERGPCGQNMGFFSEGNSTVFGECDCDYEKSSIPLVYHELMDRCFHLYTQAFCESEQWLVFSPDLLEPTCVQDRCRDVILLDPEEQGEIVEFRGKCVPLNSRNTDCKPGEVITFLPEGIHPTCAKLLDTERFSIGIRTVYRTRRLPCRLGSKRDITGKCRRTHSPIAGSNED